LDRESKVFPRLTLLRPTIYLLYADESGTVQDASQQYFVLAGFCVFERLRHGGLPCKNFFNKQADTLRLDIRSVSARIIGCVIHTIGVAC